jgi:hypothetical protein
MLFFRVMLCVVGLLLYLVIRELSDAPVIDPASPPATAASSDTVPMMPPWDAASVGAYQPVAAKPAERRTHLP